jgi:hypothetical protein
MCLADGPWVINATFEVLRYDSGFTAMITGVGVPSEFADRKEVKAKGCVSRPPA